jgi:aspartate kinase
LRELDVLLSVGESISVALTSMAVAELGGRAVSLSGAQAGILTDGQYGNARLRDVQPRRIHQALAAGSIVLVSGFQGQSAGGDVTTLGRGGSDASAVALAAALGATECEIFTDVPAVFTADPRVVPDARPLRSIRHRQMLEMAEAGAAVMQSRSIELAMAHGIDIHLRSSFTEAEGTWIRQERTRFVSTGALDGPTGDPSGVVGIAHRRHETLHTVKDVDLGSVSVVGLGMGRRPDVVVRALGTLREAAIQARLVTTTPGRVSVLVESALVDETVRLLHATFFPPALGTALRAVA